MCVYCVLFSFQVTYRSYAGSQLLSGWTPHPAQQQPICKQAALRNSTHWDAVDLKGLNSQPHVMSCENISIIQTIVWMQKYLILAALQVKYSKY